MHLGTKTEAGDVLSAQHGNTTRTAWSTAVRQKICAASHVRRPGKAQQCQNYSRSWVTQDHNRLRADHNATATAPSTTVMGAFCRS